MYLIYLVDSDICLILDYVKHFLDILVPHYGSV